MNDLSLGVRGVAHDLNNQIMVLLNALDHVMVLCPDDDDVLRAVKAAERCAALTGQLLPHRRSQSMASSTSLRELVSEAAMLMRPLLPVCNRLDVECQSDCCVSADPSEIQQALLNLFLNAVEAMNGSGRVRIRAAYENNSAVICVSDTGPGVPVELRERIFEPLFTTHAARGGNGLGLARARSLVEKHGGAINVYEVFPQGALFRIVLPALP